MQASSGLSQEVLPSIYLFIVVIPAKAGNQRTTQVEAWVPAFAGMTIQRDKRKQ
jgi:hypothetical protein